MKTWECGGTADRDDSKSSAERRVGSNPTTPTKWILRSLTKEHLSKLVAASTSYRQVGQKLGLRGGGSFRNLKELIKSFEIDTDHFLGRGWSKGKTKESHLSIAQAGSKTSKKLTGRTGRLHTKETRQKMSKSASERSSNNGLVKTKRYDVFCPYLNRTVKVQGTWERDYAIWLNENQIRWTKDWSISFSWKKSPEDIERSYHPDFLLVDSNTHIEIKGFMWKIESKNVDDALKLRLVQEQNPELQLQVLMKEDLVQLGVFK